jgi:hypothetical protein
VIDVDAVMAHAAAHHLMNGARRAHPWRGETR